MRTEPPMSPAYWQQYLDGRLNLISQTLGTKATEYATGGDRMHNFNRTYIAAAGGHRHREDGMLGMMLKHWVSILDMVDALADGTLPKEAVVKEKFGDMINYCMLMEASILHKIDLKGSLFETEEVLKAKGLWQNSAAGHLDVRPRIPKEPRTEYYDRGKEEGI